jgi:hypothetical protein
LWDVYVAVILLSLDEKFNFIPVINNLVSRNRRPTINNEVQSPLLETCSGNGRPPVRTGIVLRCGRQLDKFTKLTFWSHPPPHYVKLPFFIISI